MRNFFAGLGMFAVGLFYFFNVGVKKAALAGSGIPADVWPKACLVVLMLLSVVLMIQSVQKAGGINKIFAEVQWKNLIAYKTLRILIAFGSSFIYVQSMRYIGFVFASILFLALMLFLLGYRKPSQIIISPIVLSLAMILLFSKIIGVPLPEGMGVFATVTAFLA